jgi:bifunctional non-homologous end joining protein LigD
MSKTPLAEYSAKRRFQATPEPGPAFTQARRGPLLFVVQKHSATRLHYDLRLELDGVLKSWAVPRGPSLDRSEKRLAVETEDHPFDYASFEGVIPPKQYGAGEVIVWDCGVYSPDEDGTWYHDRAQAELRVREELARGKLSFTLRGGKLKGSFALVKTRQAKQWLLIKHRDRFESSNDITARDRSVLSGVAVEELKVVPARRIDAGRLVPAGELEPMPEKLAPMLAELGEAPFNREGWMWEPKLDGYRVLAFITAKGTRLRSRAGLDLAATFPRIAAELTAQAVDGMILDGELVAFDAAGRPSFAALQERAQLKSATDIAVADRTLPVAFFAFDLLYFAGVNLCGASYAERRRYLAQCLLPAERVQLVHADEDGIALAEAAAASGFEGVIGKRTDSRYEPGRRSGAWIKVKPVRSADFVIGGYSRGKGSRASLGALLVGYRERGKLRYASHVGSGFDARSLAQVKKHLDAIATDKCPFAATPQLNGPTVWVEPKLVAEVQFHEWTPEGALRAPVFMRLRDDVDAKKVRRESHSREGGNPGKALARDGLDSRLRGNDILVQLDNRKSTLTLALGSHTLKLTNLDRVYWPANLALKQPAYTKRDLLRYLAQVSEFMLPHLADRPLTMIRMPDGIRGQRFFQKHWEQARPAFVETITVWSGHKDESHEYLLCNNLPTLLWLAQSGTLEFHIWHSRAKPGPDCASRSADYASSQEAIEGSVLNYPDWVVFDIDPYIYSGKEAPGGEPELNTAAFEKGKEVAFHLRELLQGMSLEAIVKTSGKTGLHVFVPIRRTLDFDAARHVSEMVGRHLMRLHPRDITLEWSVPKRTGKIFMDYNMNVRGKTLNVAYSPRGEPGAPVSMPLTWEELASAHPLDFTLANAAERVARTGDRWRDALASKQSLERALKRAKA